MEWICCRGMRAKSLISVGGNRVDCLHEEQSADVHIIKRVRTRRQAHDLSSLYHPVKIESFITLEQPSVTLHRKTIIEQHSDQTEIVLVPNDIMTLCTNKKWSVKLNLMSNFP
eukprot:GHVH01004902.1.p1 GENE.GHVH01004902.1~~GHVH01004902.1.p1  ORF type:complete len:113 (-),score=12.67 GHVH01004902.1:25-363(-)